MMTPDDDEEEEDVDYDDRVYAIMKAQGKFNSDEIMDFSNEAAGIHEVRFDFHLLVDPLSSRVLAYDFCFTVV